MNKKKNKKSWKNIRKRVLKQLKEDNMAMISGGVAFYLYLSLFPAIIAIIGFYGLLTDPEQVSQQLSKISHLLPEQAQSFISQRLSNLVDKSSTTLSLGVVFSVMLGLWSANNGTRALFKGVTIAYDRDNTRGFLQATWITLIFTVSGIVIVLLSIIMVIGFPTFINQLELPVLLEYLANPLRWLILGIIIYFSFSTIYRFAPLRNKPKFRWLNWGGAVAAGLWLLGSGAFSLFISNFGSLDQIFGPVGAIIILMLWFLLSSFCILLGAEINSILDN